jgi:hypothetical protein
MTVGNFTDGLREITTEQHRMRGTGFVQGHAENVLPSKLLLLLLLLPLLCHCCLRTPHQHVLPEELCAATG